MKQVETPLALYELEDHEVAEVTNFNEIQRAGLCNLRTQLILNKSNLEVNTSDYIKYVQQEAHLRGQIAVLNQLLTMAEDESTEGELV